MPNRPTKEFWDEVYPQVAKQYGNTVKARAVTANAWKHLHPSTRREFEHLRAVRERGK